MSRLFSHLENISRDPTAITPPEPALNPAPMSVSYPDAIGSPLTEFASVTLPHSMLTQTSVPAGDIRPPDSTNPVSSSLTPSYAAIAADLASPSALQSLSAKSGPIWTVRLWFFSLLAVIGLSFAALLMPALPPVTATAPVQVGLPSANEAPTPHTAGHEAPSFSTISLSGESASPAPVNAPPSADSRAFCSEAMTAMNLCSTPAR